MLKDAGDKLAASDRAPIESAVEDLKKAIERNDVAEMKRAMEALNTAQHTAAAAMYKNANTAGAGPQAGQSAGSQEQAPTGSASNGDVIDAEVVEEEKK
jgi:molecular chaperone DnaK